MDVWDYWVYYPSSFSIQILLKNYIHLQKIFARPGVSLEGFAKPGILFKIKA